MIEQNAHLCWSQRASCSVLQHGANLFESNARKPFHKLGHQCAIFKIFKQCCDWHAGAGKYPRTTDARGIALNCMA